MSTLVLNYSLWSKFTVNSPHPKFSEHFLAPLLTHYENVYVHIYAFVLQTASDIQMTDSVVFAKFLEDRIGYYVYEYDNLLIITPKYSIF